MAKTSSPSPKSETAGGQSKGPDRSDPGGRRTVVVLGSGRSGTSLCSKILLELGIRMEITLQRANEMNPDGFHEDAVLANLNARFLEKLSPIASFGLLGDVELSKVRAEMKDLCAHIAERTADDKTTWGFKHPRTSLLLPIYRRAFQTVGIVPRYVFCARAPEAIVESLYEVGSASRDMCEAIYFMRSFRALRDCSADCYVLHYESLLEQPEEHIAALWDYVAEGDPPCPLDAGARKALVNPKLDRSSLRAVPLTNPFAKRIGALLDGMRGTDFDRDAVLAELRDIDEAHRSYEAWFEVMARQAATKNVRLDEERNVRQRCLDTLGAENTALRAENVRLDEERNAAVSRCRSKECSLQELRAKLDRARQRMEAVPSLKEELKSLKRDKTEAEKKRKAVVSDLSKLRGSVRYRLGDVLVRAVRQPGMNTLKLPWRLVTLRRRRPGGTPQP